MTEEVRQEPTVRTGHAIDARDIPYALVNSAADRSLVWGCTLLALAVVSWLGVHFSFHVAFSSAILLTALATLVLIVFSFGFLFAVHTVKRQLDEDFTRERSDCSPRISMVSRFVRSLDARESLTEIRTRYDLLLSNIAASVMLADRNRKVLFCSPYTEVLTGYAPPDLDDLAKHFDLILEKDRERVERAWQVAALGEDIFVRYQIRHRRGLLLWLETRLVPVCGADGVVASIMTVTIDVTDVLTYQRQVEEQNRDLSDFTSMVSHDLKAPIFTIKGMADALLEDHDAVLGEEGRESLRHILLAGRRLEKLVSSVLAYSRVTAAEVPDDDVDLNVVLASVVQDLRGLTREVDGAIHLPADLPTLRGDAVRYYQIFSNVISNALKYRSPSRTPVVQLTYRTTSGGSIEFAVQDNGRGIPANKLADVFRPFQRVHTQNIEGSGIGLACVKKLTERLGGTVRVESTEEVGTAIFLTFAERGISGSIPKNGSHFGTSGSNCSITA